LQVHFFWFMADFGDLIEHGWQMPPLDKYWHTGQSGIRCRRIQRGHQREARQGSPFTTIASSQIVNSGYPRAAIYAAEAENQLMIAAEMASDWRD
jgi:hypothetical protein